MWMVPSVRKIGMVSSIKFTNVTPKTLLSETKPLSQEALDIFLTRLKKAGQICPLMALRSKHNSCFIPKAILVDNGGENYEIIRLYLVNLMQTFNPENLKFF